MKLFNAIELPEYRVKKDIDHTQLKAGDKLPAFLYQVFGKEFVMIGCSVMAIEYFHFILAIGELERILPEWAPN